MDNKDKKFAEEFSDFVNGSMSSAKEVAKHMANEHRYLQGQMFRVCLEYIKVLSKNYENGLYDARNEYACKTSNEIVKKLDLFVD